MFDSTIVRDKPAEFRVTEVIKGWADALGQMTPGEQARLWIPVELAYQHQPGRPDGMLVFDVELIEVKPGPAKPAPHP